MTGATGYVGRPIAAAFRRAGHEVLGLARDPAKARSLAGEEIRPVVGNLEDPGRFAQAAATCEILVHAAADPGPAAFDLDRQTVEALLSAARREGKGRVLLYTSGTWVYGDTGGRAVDETAPVNPPGYAVLRPRTERLVLEAGNVRGIVMRPGCVYGRRGSLTSMWFDGVGRGAIEVVGDGKARWAMVHQDDLADAYVRAAESGAAGEIFNLADGSAESQADMARAAGRAAGYSREIRRVPVPDAVRRLGAWAECLAYDQRLDAGKAERILGWKPRHSGFLPAAETYYQSWKAARAS